MILWQKPSVQGRDVIHNTIPTPFVFRGEKNRCRDGDLCMIVVHAIVPAPFLAQHHHDCTHTVILVCIYLIKKLHTTSQYNKTVSQVKVPFLVMCSLSDFH